MYTLWKTTNNWYLGNNAVVFLVHEKDVFDLFCGKVSLSHFLFQERRHIATEGGKKLAPVESQEIWASGVTFRRSADAWSESTRGEVNIYDRLYKSERPQTFFKGMAYSVTGDDSYIGIRGDSVATHPEAELAVYASANGEILGYTLANDVSARDIETSNPLYQPQSKVFSGSIALGPVIVLATDDLDPLAWRLRLTINRNSIKIFDDSFGMNQLKFTIQQLVRTHMAYRDLPNGIVILTGTALAVPESAMLRDGDEVTVSCSEIGTLSSIAKHLAD